jgi:hypothetical protein
VSVIARRILACIQETIEFTASVTLTGNFKMIPSSDAHHTSITNSSLQDAKRLTETPHYCTNGTWSTFFVEQGIGDRIDYIFVI